MAVSKNGNQVVESVSPPVCVNVTIKNGQSLSDPVDLGNKSAAGLVFPAAWDAAVLTFRVSADGVTYVDFLKSDFTTEYSIPVTAGKGGSLTVQDFSRWRFLKLRSGTSASPVNQTADRIIQLTTGAV